MKFLKCFLLILIGAPIVVCVAYYGILLVLTATIHLLLATKLFLPITCVGIALFGWAFIIISALLARMITLTMSD